MIYLGIDPGLDGGIAAIPQEGIVQLTKTPVIFGREYDIQGMRSVLALYCGITKPFAMLEQQIAMPGQGLSSTLQTGKGFGIWLGLLAGLEIPYQVIGARQWQTKLFTGVSSKLDTKAKSEIIAKRLFPSADFRKSERARVANDGLTDAACIAEYARRISTGTGGPVSTTPHEPMESSPEICRACGTYIPNAFDGCKARV